VTNLLGVLLKMNLFFKIQMFRVRSSLPEVRHRPVSRAIVRVFLKVKLNLLQMTVLSNHLVSGQVLKAFVRV
jgi:hypothetical protein